MSFWNWLKSLFGKKELPDDDTDEPGSFKPEPSDPLPRQSKWSHLDPEHLVPRVPLQAALNFLENHSEQFKNKGYLTVVDFSQHSGKKRFYLIGLDSGRVETHCVAHGSNSDPDNDGYATYFSNDSGSHKSSLGIYRVGETYQSSKFKHTVRLDGLSKTNNLARPRAILVHSSTYVSDSANKQGRSWGCFALQESKAKSVIDKIKGGSLLIAWHNNFPV